MQRQFEYLQVPASSPLATGANGQGRCGREVELGTEDLDAVGWDAAPRLRTSLTDWYRRISDAEMQGHDRLLTAISRLKRIDLESLGVAKTSQLTSR